MNTNTQKLVEEGTTLWNKVMEQVDACDNFKVRVGHYMGLFGTLKKMDKALVGEINEELIELYKKNGYDLYVRMKNELMNANHIFNEGIMPREVWDQIYDGGTIPLNEEFLKLLLSLID